MLKILEGRLLIRVRPEGKRWRKFHVWVRYDPRTWIETTACDQHIRREQFAQSRLVDVDNLEESEWADMCQNCVVALSMQKVD